MGKRRILVVSHCILNTASKVEALPGSCAEERRLHLQLLQKALVREIQFIQLPCPEFILYGSQRFGHVKDQFMHPHFREESRRMIQPLLLQLEEYCQHPDRFELLGVVGIEGSPSCGTQLTCHAPWKGEISFLLQQKPCPLDAVSMSPERGAFMEILEQALSDAHLTLPLLSAEEALALLDRLPVQADTVSK